MLSRDASLFPKLEAGEQQLPLGTLPQRQLASTEFAELAG